MKMRNSELSGSTYISRPRSLTIIRPSYRVLYVIRVEPEVVTSSVDGGEDHRTFDSEGSEDDTGQDHGADQAAEAAVPAPSTTPDPDPNPAPARASPPLVFTHIPQSPRIEAMLRRPIHRPRPEYRFTGPDFYILRESFMRTYSPHWRPPHGEPARQPESHMYTTMNDGQGPVSYSNRLAQWLDELPDAGEGRMEAMQSPSPQPPEAQPHVHAEKSCQHDGQSCGRAESSRPNEDQLPGPSRARCNSAPVPSAISNNHLMGTLDHRTAPQNVIMPFSAASPVADLRGGSAIPSLHHPNPLGHHPILSQELPIQLRIPKRRSSLRNITRGSQSNQVPAASISRAAPEDLVPDIESFHIDRPTAFGATQINTGHQKSLSYLQTDSKGNKSRDPADYHRLSTHIHQLFGKDSREPNSKKHARTETPVTINNMSSERPVKRARGTIDTARNRLSLRGMPGESLIDGRQSRLGRMASTAAKRMSLPVPAARSIAKVPPFPSATKYERITIGFIGDKGCGKTSLVQRYSTGYYATANPAREHKDGYGLETFHLDADGDPVRMELWDVSSECNFRTARDHCRPLATAPYSLMVVCFDISDEATLDQAVGKWKKKVELHCGGPPIILVGLKQDLRKGYPTLKLLHLDEPDSTTLGQGEQAARDMGAKAYYECSATTGEGVNEAFDAAIRIALGRRRETNPPTKMRKLLKKVKREINKLRD